MTTPGNESITDEAVDDFNAGKELAVRVLIQMKKDYGLSGDDMRNTVRMRAKMDANGGKSMNRGLLHALVAMENTMPKVMQELLRNYDVNGKDMLSSGQMQARIDANKDRGMSDGLRTALDAMNKAAAEVLVKLPAHYGLTDEDMRDSARMRAKVHANGGKGDVLKALDWMQRHYDKAR